MSEQPAEIEVTQDGGLGAFGALMDHLVADADQEAGATGAEAPAGAGDAVPPAGGTGAPDGGGASGDAPPADADAAPEAGATGATGAAGEPAGDAVPPDAGATGADTGAESSRPAAWTLGAADLDEPLGQLSNGFEENITKAYHEEQLNKLREEYPKYFEAVQQHPRLLVGVEVPKPDGQGMETLRSEEDAKSWQEATKQVLGTELHSRTTAVLEENKDFLQTIHSSIDLFKNNKDLRPFTADFDVDLANRFADVAKPYELRVDGKLQGYSIPVQPLIEQLRTKLTEERKAAPAKTETPPAAGTPAAPAEPPKPVDPPQAGLQSKAGTGDNKEDFSALFGTLGLPDLQI